MRFITLFKVVCPECFLVWCFPCQAPWHEAVTCKEFRRGDKLLLKWAQQHVHGQANAQRCPKCKVSEIDGGNKTGYL